jgi:hypothetical protein
VLLLPEAHDYLKRTRHPAARIRHPLRWQGLLPHLHACPAGAGAGSRRCWCRLLPAGPSDRRVQRDRWSSRRRTRSTPHTSPRTATSLTTASTTSSRQQPTTRPSNPVVGWLAGGLNHHIVHHLCPVCLPHPLRSAHRIVQADRRRVRRSLSAASHHDPCDLASSDTFEATRKRNAEVLHRLHRFASERSLQHT